jgi:hypothetical protein
LSEYCSGIQIEKVLFVQGPKTQKDAPGAFPRHYGTMVAMALYNQGPDIPIIPMNRLRPRPKRGQGWRKGASIKTRNQSLKCNYTL